MSRWHENVDGLDHSEIFDPLCVERSAPMDDREAELVETLCHAATPGPLVVDDEAEGEGAVVASLPDGRLIVSLTASVEHTQDRAATEANAQLICKARTLVLRLLRDRQQWKGQRVFLQERLRTLESLLQGERTVAEDESLEDTVRIPLPR